VLSVKRFGGWLLVLGGLGILTYSIWLLSTHQELQSWQLGMTLGVGVGIIAMQGRRVLDRNPRKKKVLIK